MPQPTERQEQRTQATFNCCIYSWSVCLKEQWCQMPGCGSGYPVAQFLAGFFQVTGMDFAMEQIQLAKRRVPGATFICGDITSLPFRDRTFDAVVSYYTMIHIPRSAHPELLPDFHRILKPGGLALLCMGAGDLPSDVSDYHGAEMFWSHYDGETNPRIGEQVYHP